jgi:transcriptional regulator with XRE-family HTH domain
MTEIPLDAAGIEQLAKERQISMAQVCREAGISQTTFQRWKKGGDTTIGTYVALVTAIDVLSAPESTTTPTN